ncbi:hypothetical protein [Lentisalinibacter salinarum]|uniref:hypothetical protein n=1 Tax=Lentisalinibacter salinarum TaxID=2992239 RepID=UPI003869A77B
MKTWIRKSLLTATSMALLGASSLGSAAPVEAVYGFEVENPPAFVAALDRFLATDEMKAAKVSLWATEFNGSNPTTHLIVTDHQSHDAYQKMTSTRLASDAWPRYLLAVNDIADLTGETLYIERMREGGNWREHGAVAAYVMSVSDPRRYAEAFGTMIKEAGHPGSVRLMEARAGATGYSHVVLITAPNIADLNNYLDKLLAGDAYAKFVGTVGDIRKITTVSMYSRIKSWGN